MKRVRIAAAGMVLAAAVLGAGPGARAAEVSFGPGQEMMVNGKVFLPVHAWAVATRDLDRLKAMGVNVALGSGDASMSWKPISEKSVAAMREFLDGCAKREMYAVIIVSAWWSNPENRGEFKEKSLAEYMALFKEHPALLGWQVSSEDDMGIGRKKLTDEGIDSWRPRPGATPEDLARRYEEAKKADPKHPMVVMYSGGQMLAADRKFGWAFPTPETWYTEASRHGDILYHDLFPVANNTAEDLKQIADATKLLAKYGGGGKHLWVAVDAGDRKRWTTKSHAPTGKEIRCELWMAVIHGAHGLGFDFTSWKPTWASIRMSEDGERGLTSAVREIQELKEAILLGRTTRTVRATSTGEGKVDAAIRERGGKVYVFGVNVEPKACEAALAVGGLKAKKAAVIGEGRTVAVEGGAIKDAFEAYGVHLYEMEE